MNKAGVNHAVRHGCTAAQALQILEIVSMSSRTVAEPANPVALVTKMRML